MLIATDVDGTLLDERMQPPAEFDRFRDALRSHVLVLASSRTLEELVDLQDLLRVSGPMIAENGAVVAVDEGLVPGRSGQRLRVGPRRLRITPLGPRVGELQRLLNGARSSLGVRYARTRPAVVAAGHGRSRSVLLPPLPDDELSGLRAMLEPLGCALEVGGRWTTMVRGSDKGKALRRLRGMLGNGGLPVEPVAAVGNAPNDASLLLAAQRRFVIRDGSGAVDAVLGDIPGVEIPERPGVEGWTEVLERLGLPGGSGG